MACELTTRDLLRQHGLRMTAPRRTIIAVLSHRSEHRTAQAILEEVQAAHPSVNASTVYRTLAAFKQLGLVAETDLGTGETSYAWLGTERHHHLICHRCDGVIELKHRYLERLQAALRRDYGFEATVDHFAIFGLCRGCRAENG